jgi:hypothetical protein
VEIIHQELLTKVMICWLLGLVKHLRAGERCVWDVAIMVIGKSKTEVLGEMCAVVLLSHIESLHLQQILLFMFKCIYHNSHNCVV